MKELVGKWVSFSGPIEGVGKAVGVEGGWVRVEMAMRLVPTPEGARLLPLSPFPSEGTALIPPSYILTPLHWDGTSTYLSLTSKVRPASPADLRLITQKEGK